jgi:hypothetical protein
LQDQVSELPFPNDLDESSGLQLFQVMGERSGSHGLAFAHVGARDAAALPAQVPQNLVAAWIGQRLGNQMNLTLGKWLRFRQGNL